jgi:hypothetical protein
LPGFSCAFPALGLSPEENPATEIENSRTLQENPFFTQGLGEIAIFEKTPAIN